MEKRWLNIVMLLLVSMGASIYFYVYHSSFTNQHNDTENIDWKEILLQSLQSPALFNDSHCQGIPNLKKILLAINYNFPHYSSVPILRAFYEPIFGKVIFCGENEDKVLGVIKIKENNGYQGYECIATGIRNFPHFSGYIHSNDDLILNWWNLLGLDITKLWIGSRIRFHNGYVVGGSIPEWYWWRFQNAAHLCEVAFKKVEDFAKTAEGKVLDVPLYISRFFKNTGNVQRCLSEYSDFFYIPAKYAKLYATLSHIYSNENVFLEVAVPTILAHLLNESNYYDLNGMYFNHIYLYNTTYKSGEAFYETYALHLNFSHPFKMTGRMKTANINFFRNVIMSYGDVVMKTCSLRNNLYRDSVNERSLV